MSIDQLDVVNRCATASGLPPVSSINATDAQAARAIAVLDRTRQRILRRGWTFNIETYELTADDQGFISCPDAWLVVHAPDGYAEVDGRIRDLENNTFVIASSAQPMTLEVYLDYAIEQLPDCVAEWIAAETVVEFLLEFGGATQTMAVWQSKATRAKADVYNTYPSNVLDYVSTRSQRVGRYRS